MRGQTADSPSQSTPMSRDALVALSRSRIEKGSKSFAAASMLFDRETRNAVHMLYAWCRHCDDEIDGQDLGFARGPERQSRNPQAVLENLRRDTLAAVNGAPPDEPVFQALAEVSTAYRIPARLPLDHIAGFEMDVAGTDYHTIEDTLTYCYHVAGVVGVMMARVMGAGGADTLNRACDLGLAFQLTNICRDVVDDAGEGRIYLPAMWLSEAGLKDARPADVAAPANRDAVFEVVTRTLDLAETYYDSSAVGIARLPLRSAAAIAAARNIYRDIGGVIRQQGSRAWDQRARTSTPRKLLRVGQGLGQSVVRTLASRLMADSASVPGRDGLWTRPDAE